MCLDPVATLYIRARQAALPGGRTGIAGYRFEPFGEPVVSLEGLFQGV